MRHLAGRLERLLGGLIEGSPAVAATGALFAIALALLGSALARRA
jgi:hypothetical protein